MLQTLLGEYGIRAQVVETGSMEGTAVGGTASVIRGEVIVSSEDEEIARGISELFQKNILNAASEDLREADGMNEMESQESQESPEWQEWPECPSCSKRRQTVCPICKTAGRAFALGELPVDVDVADITESLTSTPFLERDFRLHQAVSSPGVLLVCDGCDEPFPPRFYNRCEHCGHEFGDGIDGEPDEADYEDPNWTFVIGIMLIIACVMGLLWMAT